MLHGNMSFCFPSTREVLNYGDFVYDKGLGLVVYHEFGFLACHQLASDHIYSLEAFQIRSSLNASIGSMAVKMPLGAMVEVQCEIISSIDNRMLYCILNPPGYDNWNFSLGAPAFGG